MEKLKILVTGANGFIGRNLISIKDDRFIFVPFEGDLLNIQNIKNHFVSHPDTSCIIHLAGSFNGDTSELFASNVNSTYNLLHTAREFNISKIVYSSSGAVYGDSNNSISRETDKLEPVNDYGITKKMSECLITDYSRIFNYNYVILRFPNVYGPGSIKGVIYDFYKSIIDTKSIKLYGNGQQSRDFLYVEDAVDSIIKSLNYDKSNIFNITNNRNYTLLEVVEEFEKIYNFSIKYMQSNNSLQSLKMSGDKSFELLGFKPKYVNLNIANIEKW